ncbi:MAG: hypothetical protein ACKVP2_16730 [Burkholderiales bacterium]
MVQAGFSQNVADLFEQMSNAMSDGRIAETLKNPVPVRATTTLEQFAGTFAAAFSAAH